MTTTYKNKGRLAGIVLGTMMVAAACTKPELDDDFPKGDPPPIGNYANSSDIAPAELVAFFPFDGTYNDSKGGVTGGTLVGRGGGFTTGKKGQAYQAGDSSFVTYTSAGPLAALTSYTVSMWINTQKHAADAQGVFAIARQDGSFWGNFFMLIESAGPTENRMFVKVHFEKNVTPAVPNFEHWLEASGDKRINDMYGAWRHLAFTYDETTSTFAMYANGNKVPFPDSEAKRFSGGTTPLGALAFKSATRFIVGGYQNHLGSPPFNGLESWMKTYTGRLDELRIYKKALTATDLNALFQLEKQGR